MSNFPTFVEHKLKIHLANKVAFFQAGQICKFHNEWSKLTSDPEILEMVEGANISFNGPYPVQHSSSNSLPCSEETD